MAFTSPSDHDGATVRGAGLHQRNTRVGSVRFGKDINALSIELVERGEAEVWSHPEAFVVEAREGAGALVALDAWTSTGAAFTAARTAHVAASPSMTCHVPFGVGSRHSSPTLHRHTTSVLNSGLNDLVFLFAMTRFRRTLAPRRMSTQRGGSLGLAACSVASADAVSISTGGVA